MLKKIPFPILFLILLLICRLAFVPIALFAVNIFDKEITQSEIAASTFTAIINIFITYISILAIKYIYKNKTISFDCLKINKNILETLLLIVLCLFLILVVFSEPFALTSDKIESSISIVITITLVPILEEYLFRFLYFQNMKVFDWKNLLLNALLFAIIHSYKIQSKIFIFIFSFIFLTIPYFIYRNYLLNVLVHAAWNIFIYVKEANSLIKNWFKNISIVPLILVTILLFLYLFRKYKLDYNSMSNNANEAG